VDADLVVKLIEVNSSPAVAEDLLQPLVNDLVEIISPSFPPVTQSNGWELVL
jgi:hypothetical protein